VRPSRASRKESGTTREFAGSDASRRGDSPEHEALSDLRTQLTFNQVPSSRIFISYRRGDTSPHAGRLADRLVGEFGEERVFMDVDTIEPGADFVEYIEEAVGGCEVLIAVIGDDWLDSRDEHGNRRLEDPEDFVRLEVSAGLERDIRVVPVLVERATMPRAHELPEPLRRLARRNALEISDLRWRHDVSRLVATIHKVLEGKGTEQAIREADAGPGALATEAPGAKAGPAAAPSTDASRVATPPAGPPALDPPPPPAEVGRDAGLYSHGPQPSRPKLKASAALVLGIISILLFWAAGIGLLAGIPAIILGAQSRAAAKRSEVRTGKRFASAGMWTGITGVVLGIAIVVALAIDISNDP
jgi:hypothetical protein